MFTYATLAGLPGFVDRHGAKVIAAMSSLMVGFFITFLAILVQANQAGAQSGETCSGVNLIEKYRLEDPEKIARLEAQAGETTNGDAVFWKIEKEGLPASWLLGTMHMADDRIARLEGEKLTAFNAAGTIIVENIEALDPAQASATLLQHKEMTLYTDGTTLADRLDEESLALLKEATEARGMPFAMVQIMQPWLVAVSIALPECELASKRTGSPVLDALIAEKAKTEGKTLIGLESAGEQFSAMAGLPEAFHLKSLKETLKLGDIMEDVMHTMKELYLEERIDLIMPLTKIVSPQTGNADEFEDFERSLIVNRNAVMVERALPHLETGNVFIAVGALHLPNESGLVNAFREAGYSVSAIY